MSRVNRSDLEQEYKRVSAQRRLRNVLLAVMVTLVSVASVSVLVATLWMPVLKIYGDSMNPTLLEGSIVISSKTGSYKRGDVIAFYYNNKVLVKRVIATPRQWVSIAEDGTVSVDGVVLDEPYVDELALGQCDLTFPYQVPEDSLFVMGDHRSISVDSRHSQVGCITDEMIVGRLFYTVWPFGRAGKIG